MRQPQPPLQRSWHQQQVLQQERELHGVQSLEDQIWEVQLWEFQPTLAALGWG